MNYDQRKYRKVRAFVDKIKLEAGCMDCGYSQHSSALEFDHVRGEKHFNIGARLTSVSRARLVAEMLKCDVVCANCHRVRTAERRL